MPERIITTAFSKTQVRIDDTCGCITGGFLEKELTHHGFRGASWKETLIYCDNCGSRLHTIGEVAARETNHI